MNKPWAIVILLTGTLLAALGLYVPSLQAQQGNALAPGIWRGDVQRPRPDMSGLPPLRILTEADYPPFNYYDEEGALTGFNVELMQAVCEVMEVACSFEVRDFELLLPALVSKEADVVAASITISPETLMSADFSERYYEMPARFITRKGRDQTDILPENVEGMRVGVVAGTRHEAYLRTFFPKATLVPMQEREKMREAMVESKLDAIFDDAVTSVFWLNGTSSKGCCTFRGSAFMDAAFFGDGVGFAVKKGDRRLRDFINYALEKVRRDGTYEELFLRYFPLSFY